MTFGDATAGFYELGAHADREDIFIGGIHGAVDTNAQILTSVMAWLIAVEQIAATSVFKSEQMEGYLAGRRQEIADALVKVNTVGSVLKVNSRCCRVPSSDLSKCIFLCLLC